MNLLENKPKIILWDWNGTLLDDLELCLQVINKMLAKRHLPAVGRDRYRTLFDFPVSQYYQQIGFDFSLESFEDLSTEFIQNYEKGRPRCQLVEGARSTLTAGAHAGIEQSILSASKREYLQAAVRQYRLEGFFTAVLGLEDHHAAGKQSLAAGWLAERGLDPQEILLIGDTTHDAAVAASLGLRCILVPNGHQSRQRLARCGATLVDSLDDIQALLSDLATE